MCPGPLLFPVTGEISIDLFCPALSCPSLLCDVGLPASLPVSVGYA